MQALVCKDLGLSQVAKPLINIQGLGLHLNPEKNRWKKQVTVSGNDTGSLT